MITLPQPWPVNPWPTSFRTVRASDPDQLPPGLRFLTVQSDALAGRGDIAIHVPPAVEAAPPGFDVPIVILLHGVYGSFWNWSLNGGAHVVLDELIASGAVGPMVLAMPSDGLRGEGTAYLTHDGADVERWLVDAVPTAVREAIPLTGSASPVALCGNSMGGFGALRTAARHGTQFAAVAAHSAITDLDDLAAFTVADIGDAAGVEQAERALTTVISNRASTMPPIHFDCGRDDPLVDANRTLHAQLDTAGIVHTYEEYEGGHDWASWHRRLPVSLRFFDREFARALEPTP